MKVTVIQMQSVLILTEATLVPVMMATLVMAIVAKVCVFLLTHCIFCIFDFHVIPGKMVAPNCVSKTYETFQVRRFRLCVLCILCIIVCIW